MKIFGSLFGGQEDSGKEEVIDDDLKVDQTGSKEKKPKAEISEKETVILTERDRFWEGMK